MVCSAIKRLLNLLTLILGIEYMLRAKFLVILCLLSLWSSQLVWGQTETSQAKWPLEIGEFQVSIVNVVRSGNNNNSNMPSSNPMGMGGMGMGMGMGTNGKKGSEQKITFSLKPRNDSAKTVETIVWEARFTDSESHLFQKEFTSKKSIKPGKDQKIEETIPFNIALLPSTAKIGFRITKIEYGDKSTWEEGTKDSEAGFVYKNISFTK